MNMSLNEETKIKKMILTLEIPFTVEDVAKQEFNFETVIKVLNDLFDNGLIRCIGITPNNEPVYGSDLQRRTLCELYTNTD